MTGQFLDVSLHVKVINSYKFQISHFSTYLFWSCEKKQGHIFKFTWIHSETVRDMGQTLGIKWYAGWCFWFQRGHNLQFSRSSFIDWTMKIPLKNMSSSVGMMKFPIYGKSKNSCSKMFQTINQNYHSSCRKPSSWVMSSIVYAGWWLLLIWLVVSTPLKNISQWEGVSHILWKIKNVWNHQPVMVPNHQPA